MSSSSATTLGLSLSVRITLAELAAHLGAQLEGQSDLVLTGVQALSDAGPADLSFLANRRYLNSAQESQAGAIAGCGVQP